MGILSDLIVRIGADATDLNSELDRSNAATRQWAESVTRTLDGIGSSLTRLGTTLTVGITAPLTALGGLSLSAAADMDSLTRALEAVNKSGESVTAQLERLKEVAKLPGLGFKEAIEGSVRLQAAGMSAQQAEKALMAFGNALAIVGKGRAELDGVILALTQIASKSKVSAEEINQLAERVPQIREVMKNVFGTADTEVLQKAKIAPKVFIDAIVEEFARLPKVTSSFKNDLENLKDSIQQTFAELGKSLLPVAQQLLQASQPILAALKSMAEGFAALPQPVQTFTIAALAAVAALGPLSLATGAAISGISSMVGAFGTLAPICATVAASIGNIAYAISNNMIGALGSGEAALLKFGAAAAVIAAVATAFIQLRDLGKELGDIFPSLGGVFSGLGTALSNFWSSLWPSSKVEEVKSGTQEIEGFFTRIKDAIANIDFGRIFKASLGPIAAMTEALRQLKDLLGIYPDMDKAAKDMAVNLGKQAAAQMKVSDATLQQMAAATGLIGKQNQVNKLLIDGAGASDKAAKKTKEHADQLKAADIALADYIVKLGKAREDAEIAAGAFELWTESLPEVTAEAFDLSDALGRVSLAARDLKPPQWLTDTSGWKAVTEEANKYAEALKSVGKVNETDLRSNVEKFAGYYETISGRSTSTMAEITQAWVNQEKAAIDYARATGQAVDEEWATLVQGVEDSLNQTTTASKGHVEKQKTIWSEFGTQVSTIFTDLGRGISDLLWKGGEWGKTMIGIAQQIGEAFTRILIEGAMKQLIASIAKATSGMEGLLGSVGKWLGGVAGTGGTATKTAADAAKNVTDAAKVGKGAAGATGILGTIDAVGSVVSAISGIIGNFQNAKMETTLNAIEESTRYTRIFIGEQADSLLETSHQIRNMLSDFFKGGVGFVGLIDLMTQLTNKMVWGGGGVPAIPEYGPTSVAYVPSASYAAQGVQSSSPLSITITGNTFRSRDDIDYTINEITRRLRDRGF